MVPYNVAVHGPWHGSTAPGARFVSDTSDGVAHGHAPDGVFIGCCRPGAGRNEAGQVVSEMLAPAVVAARTAAPAAEAALASKRAAAVQAIRDEVTRIKAIPAITRTSAEKGFMGLAYIAMREE